MYPRLHSLIEVGGGVESLLMLPDIYVDRLFLLTVRSVADPAAGGESTDHQRRSADRIYPPLHIKLHLQLREYQGQVHAGDNGNYSLAAAACCCADFAFVGLPIVVFLPCAGMQLDTARKRSRLVRGLILTAQPEQCVNYSGQWTNTGTLGHFGQDQVAF